MNTLAKKKIDEIVDMNYIHASILYYFGIEFYNYSEQTLEQACVNKGLDVATVVNKLESPRSCEESVAIEDFPIELVIEYLKHTHFLFIKQKMPYLSTLISELKVLKGSYNSLAKDLKFVFPLFVEDFIHHIYQEEDTLFNYIHDLLAYQKGKANVSKLYFEMEKNGLTRFASEHEEHDDEMAGIRQITNNYSIQEYTPLHIKVIFSELKTLEKELIIHANVENDILFPKALMLEREIIESMKQNTRYN